MDPPELEPAELMEHMELFLEPSEEGEEGGVWNTTPPDTDLISKRTCGRKTVPVIRLASVPDPKLFITDPDPQIENQEFCIRIRIRIRILDPDPSVNLRW